MGTPVRAPMKRGKCSHLVSPLRRRPCSSWRRWSHLVNSRLPRRLLLSGGEKESRSWKREERREKREERREKREERDEREERREKREERREKREERREKRKERREKREEKR